MPERRRIAVVCGGIPQDSTHLAMAAQHVELSIHRSSWLPAGVAASQNAPPGAQTHDYTPVWRTRRGHLGFAYRGLLRGLTSERPDVVHVISEPWGLLAVQAAAWVRRNPQSRLVLHGCDTIWHHGGTAERAARRMLLRRTLPFTDAWLAENDKALALAVDNGLPATSDRARVHTNPRDAALFRLPTEDERRDARASLAIDDHVAVGLITRLVPEKGVKQFLQAARVLLDQGVRAKFFIAGDGPLLAEVQQARCDGIVPLGRLPHPQGVLGLLRALDVLASPSLTTPSWEDQGPRAVLEALLCGVVPVASPTGALPEMLDGHGVLARSVEHGHLAEALHTASRASGNRSARAELAIWARNQWSAPAVAAQLLDIWTRVHERSPSGGRAVGAGA